MSEADNPYQNLLKEVEHAQEDLDQDESVYIPQRPAHELFRLESVQIFFVRGDGVVSTFSEPAPLRIIRLDEDAGNCSVFIQVGGWTHPLIPGASPVLEASNGILMFPDVYSESESSSIGVLLPDEISDETRASLISILNEYTALQSNPKADADYSNLGTVGKTLLKSAELVSKGLEQGAAKAVSLIEYVGEKHQLNQKEGGNDKVNPALKVTAKGAKYASSATVKVSGFVAKRVTNLTKSLANNLAKKATPAKSADGSSMVKSGSFQTLIDATRGGLLAYGTVYSTLEDSAKIVGSSLKSNSVKVVECKYGTESAQVFDDSMTAAGNAAMTYMNVQSLGVKGLVKKTAKETGKQIGKNVIMGHPDKKE